ncbi:MAG: hypothetical protein JW795_16555 [Chitinivibrionales bacterium]|nr:hypothetical protein [Chitinivibrionales bacterium]
MRIPTFTRVSLFSLYCILLLSIIISNSFALSPTNTKIRGSAELGFLGVLSHTIQFGTNGTLFDYVDNGGQDVLFAASRLSAEIDIGTKNTIVLLYQPLRIETQDDLKKDLIVDNESFSSLSGVKFLYSFPFYRISYLRNFRNESNSRTLGIGISLQIRNATISFESLDGKPYYTNRNVGLVPALKVTATKFLTERVFFGFEADGIYAPVSYLNGSDNKVVGAILDANLRMGTRVSELGSVYGNIRYLGGGATGTDTKTPAPKSGYVKNWLHFLFVTTGFMRQF